MLFLFVRRDPFSLGDFFIGSADPVLQDFKTLTLVKWNTLCRRWHERVWVGFYTMETWQLFQVLVHGIVCYI